MSLKIKDIMVKDIISVGTDTTVRKAVELMSQHEIGCLIVLGPVGILTERDMVKRVLNESRDPENTKVSEIMSSPLVVGKPEMDIDEAVKLMVKQRIKKLPVVENQRLLGLVTLTDLVRSPEMIKILINALEGILQSIEEERKKNLELQKSMEEKQRKPFGLSLKGK